MGTESALQADIPLTIGALLSASAFGCQACFYGDSGRAEIGLQPDQSCLSTGSTKIMRKDVFLSQLKTRDYSAPAASDFGVRLTLSNDTSAKMMLRIAQQLAAELLRLAGTNHITRPDVEALVGLPVQRLFLEAALDELPSIGLLGSCLLLDRRKLLHVPLEDPWGNQHRCTGDRVRICE